MIARPISIFLGLSVCLSCATQEPQPGVAPEDDQTEDLNSAAARRKRITQPVLAYDPGPVEAVSQADSGDPPCTGAALQFQWLSSDMTAAESDRQTISVRGRFSEEDLFLEMEWEHGDESLSWQSLEEGSSLAHWRDLVNQPMSPSGTRLSGVRAPMLTVIYEEDCTRSGVPQVFSPWVALDSLILSHGGPRPQVVLALEQANDIKSVELHCKSGWKERIGVRDGRARFTDVPREECQAGWIGDRRGWVVLDAQAELFQCIFETDSVNCTTL